MKSPLPVLLLFALLPLVALGAPPEMPALWKSKCALCHGKDGRGRTTTGRALKIADLTKLPAEGPLTAEAIRHAIREGVKDERGRFRMVPYGTDFTEAQVESLVAYVMEIAPGGR